MSDYQLLIKIAGQLDGSLSSSVKEAQSLLGTLNKKGAASALLQGVGTAVSGVVKAQTVALAAVGAASAKVGKDALTNGKEFETAMSQVAATMGVDKTDAGFQALQETVLELGRTTNFTSREVAEGANIVAMAGYDYEESMAMLPSVLKLAGAGALDMNESATYLASTIASFGLEKTTDNIEHVGDVMATIASSAQTDVRMLGEAYSRMGANGTSLKYGVEEFGALAGVLANVNITGSEAGIKIRNITNSLQAARNKDAAQMFKDLGINAYDANNELREVADIFRDINKATEGMDEKELDNVINTLFNKTDRAAAKALLNNLDQYDELLEGAMNSSGSMSAMYQRQMDNLQGDLDLLASAYDGFTWAVYNAMKGADESIRGIVQTTTGYVEELTAALNADGFLGIADTLGDIFGDVADKINTAGPEAVNAAFDFVDQLFQSIGEQSNAESIGQAAANVVTTFGERFITNTGEFAIAAGNLIDSFVTSLSSDDVNAGERIAEAVTQAISNVGNWFSENGADLGDAAGQLISQLVTGIATHADEIVPAGLQIAGGIAKGLIQGAGRLAASMPAVIGSLLSAIPSTLAAVTEVGQGIGESLVEGIKTAVSGFGETFHELLDLLFDVDYGSVDAGVEEMFTSQTTAMIDAIQTTWNSGAWMKEAFGVDYNTYQPVGENPFADKLNEWVQTGATIQDVTRAVEESDNAFISADYTMQDVADAYIELANSSLDTAQANVEAANAAKLEAAAVEMIGEASEETSTAVDTVNSALSSLGDASSLEGIEEEIMAAGESADATDAAMSSLYDTMSSMGDIGDDVLTSLLAADDMEAKASEIMAAMDTVSSGVTSAISNMQSGVAESMASLAESLSSAAEAFDSLVSAAESAASGVAAAMQTAATEAAAAMTSITGADGGTIDAPTMSGDPTAGLDTSSKEITITMDASQVTAAVAEIQTAMTTLGESATTASATFTAGMQVVGNGAQNANAVASAAIITMVSIMTSQFAVAVASAQSAASGIYSAFAGIDLAGVASNMMAGLTAGIEAGGAAAVAAAQNVASQVAAAMSSALQISSPSKVTTEIGYYTGMGLPVGMESSLPEVLATTKSFSNAVADTMDNSLSAPVAAIASGKGRGSERSANTAPGMGQATFAPVINITVNGGATEETAQNIAALTMEQFRRFYEQMIRQDRRTAFA